MIERSSGRVKKFCTSSFANTLSIILLQFNHERIILRHWSFNELDLKLRFHGYFVVIAFSAADGNKEEKG